MQNDVEDDMDRQLAEEIGECVKQLIPLLDPAHRDIIQIVDVERREIGDAALRLHLSVTQARVRLHQARHALRILLTLACATCPHDSCDGCACDGCAVSRGERHVCH
jgi:DNA-directed RNA polymerase specialized sigma24 family protein